MVPEDGVDGFEFVGRDLDDRTQFLVEEGGQGLGGQGFEIDLQSAAPREGHLAKGGKESAVRAVVVGEHEIRVVERLDGVEESAQEGGIVQVRGVGPHPAVDLGQGGAAQAISPLAEIDQQQPGVAGIAA